MKKSPSLILAAFCTSAITAQVTVKLETLNAAGVALAPTTGPVQTANFAANTVLTGRSNSRTVSGQTQFAHGLLTASIIDPRTLSLQSRVQVGPRTALRSIHSTDSTAGKPGPNRFLVTLSAAKPTTVRVHWQAFLHVSHANGRSRLAFKRDVSRAFVVQGIGNQSDTDRAVLEVDGTTEIEIELDTYAEPGTTATTSLAASRLNFWIVEVPVGSFRTFGRSCSAAKVSAPRIPRQGSLFTLNLDGATPNSAAFLLVGLSKSHFHFLPLPYDMTGLGLPGCDLNVGYIYMRGFPTNASGQASITVGLPETAGVLYAQWADWAFRAPSRPIRLTQGAEIRY